MFTLIAVFVAVVLLVVLTYKYAGLDRGIDPMGRTTPPQEEPKVDDAKSKVVQEQMENLQQVLVPVQYVDNGLLPRIQKNLPEVIPKHREEYSGPAPFSTESFHTKSFESARFEEGLSLVPDFPMEPPPEEVEPFNSFQGMVVSDQDISLVGS